MVSSFRLIQPAVQQSLPIAAIEESGHARTSSVKLGKRIHSVAQACRNCRQNKVKVIYLVPFLLLGASLTLL
jgi:sirohydrochlorin ferrochelatase